VQTCDGNPGPTGVHVGPALAEGCVNATTISAQIARAPIAIDSVRFMAFNRSNRPAPERPGCRAWRVDTGQWVRVRGRGWGTVREGGTRQFHYIIDMCAKRASRLGTLLTIASFSSGTD
jgi:hypothetical protein